MNFFPIRTGLCVLALLGLSQVVTATTVTVNTTYNPSLYSDYFYNYDPGTTSLSSPVPLGPFTTSNGTVSDGVLEQDGAIASNITGNTNYQYTAGASAYAWGAPTYNLSNIFVQSSYQLTDTITNTSGSAQNYTFNLNLAGGRLGTSCSTCTGTAMASYSVAVLLNGVSIWDSYASLDQTLNLITGGNSIGGSLSGNEFSWNNYSTTVDLGILASGASANLSYQVTIYASAGSTSSSSDNRGYITFGDPSSLSSQPASSFSAQSAHSTVPEPAGIFLILPGLLALGKCRKLS